MRSPPGRAGDGPAPPPATGRRPVIDYRPAAAVGAPNLFCPGIHNAYTVSAVEKWEASLAEAGELRPAIVESILDAHDERGARAIEAVAEERVKQYRDFIVVVGHTEEYVVEGDSCDCADATYNLDDDDPDQLCWHAIAVRIATHVDAVDHHDMWYSEVREFL